MSIPRDKYQYGPFWNMLKNMFEIENDTNIEVYDSDGEELSKAILLPNSRKKLQIVLINKRFENNNNDAASASGDDEAKSNGNLIKDELSKNKFRCYFKACRKTFKIPLKLINHIKIHFKNKPFKCEYEGCDKSFLCKGQLRNHQSIHIDVKKFNWTFEGCDKSYNKKSRLLVHMRVHTGEKPFACKFEGCNKRFAEKGNLKTHIRTHTGEKPYFWSFEDCGQSFTTQGHLVDHERRHRDEKPFKCNIWNKAFMRSSTVKVHMKTHVGEENCYSQSSKSTFQKQSNSHKIEIKLTEPMIDLDSNMDHSNDEEEEKIAQNSPKRGYAVPYSKLQQPKESPNNDKTLRPKQTCSMIATITSSCEGIFENVYKDMSAHRGFLSNHPKPELNPFSTVEQPKETSPVIPFRKLSHTPKEETTTKGNIF